MNLADHGFSLREQAEIEIKPFAEHAGALRKQLIQQGWSRTGAEKLATELISVTVDSSNTRSLIELIENNDEE